MISRFARHQRTLFFCPLRRFSKFSSLAEYHEKAEHCLGALMAGLDTVDEICDTLDYDYSDGVITIKDSGAGKTSFLLS